MTRQRIVAIPPLALALLAMLVEPAAARIKLATLPVRERVELQLDNGHFTLPEQIGTTSDEKSGKEKTAKRPGRREGNGQRGGGGGDHGEDIVDVVVPSKTAVMRHKLSHL